jgi:hypothetical protein
MREARYSERSTRSAAASTPIRPAVGPAMGQEVSGASAAPPTDALCGHRSMNGRTCTREVGHAAKSHRYS